MSESTGMRAKVNCRCPHCGQNNWINIYPHHQAGNTQIIYCDADDGGCEKRYIADFKITVEAQCFKVEDKKKEKENG